MKDDHDSNDNREKERDRKGRGGGGARRSRFSDADSGGRDRSRGPDGRNSRNCRIYISNIPYDYRWQDLKDLFRRVVGSVEYVELFHDESGKSRGCGIVEFKDPDNVQVAMDKMNRYEVNGRELVVKEDHGEQRDQYGRILREGGGGGGGGGGGNNNSVDRGYRRDDDRSLSGRNNFNMSNDFNSSSSNYNLYGLSASFLESLGITGPLHNKVFVANLDYKVDSKKLKQVFKLAGKVQSVDLSLDKDGNSRGFAVVEYDHPVEAVQAISMLDRQMLYDRRMTVRLDRIPDKGEGLKLPEGLGGVGLGLGPNGEPLKDVARNLPSIVNPTTNTQQQNISSSGNGNSAADLFNNAQQQTSPIASMPIAQQNKQQQSQLAGLNLGNLSSTNLAALSNVVGGLGAALANPLLTSSLSNLGLNLGGQSAGLNIGGNGGGSNQNDLLPSSNSVGLSNNYTSGNNYSSGGSGGGGGYGGGGGSAATSYNPNALVGGNSLDNDNFKAAGLNFAMAMAGGGGNVGSNVSDNANNARKSDTIIIKNLPLNCTWQTLRDKFRDVGEVKFAEIRGNDVGVVRFFKERDAELAIALMNGSRIDGRTIKVSYF